MVDTTTIRHLQAPCNGEGDINTFPGPQTKGKCKHTLLFFRMLQQCGYKLQILWKVHLEYSRKISDVSIENTYNINPDFAYFAGSIMQQEYSIQRKWFGSNHKSRGG